MDETSDEQAAVRIAGAVREWDLGATCLAALAVVTDGAAGGDLAATARAVMAAAGLGDVLADPPRMPFSAEQVHGMAASPLLQATALVSGSHADWSAHSDETLIAQGRASASAATLFTTFVLPHFAGFADRLARPGARMLDVGTGVGALAIGYAQAFPQLHVTGLDVMPRVLRLAQAQIEASPVAERVEVRQADVAELADEAAYDLAWIPAPFIPQPAFSNGVARIAAALRPGGMLMIGHGIYEGTELENAIARFKTVGYGGTPLDGESAARLLAAHGLTAIRRIQLPPGAPGLTVGLR
ncbi:SAM-dependent methyltransferase [Dactylosporangium sp. CA-139066]|uniref:SAM-dependent methyltransferase n=1 Tax=Dactylosporangium sp. CA-139066 TaxID=3239930 RepID=UPI003D90C054